MQKELVLFGVFPLIIWPPCPKMRPTWSSWAFCLSSKSTAALATASLCLCSHCCRSEAKCLVCTSSWLDRDWISATWKRKDSFHPCNAEFLWIGSKLCLSMGSKERRSRHDVALCLTCKWQQCGCLFSSHGEEGAETFLLRRAWYYKHWRVFFFYLLNHFNK